MSLKQCLSAAVVAFSSLCFQFAKAQNFDTVKISQKLPVLNGRAFFTFPEHAIVKQREVDIMSADPNMNTETRITLLTGDVNIVFVAHDFFAIAGKDLKAEVDAVNKKYDMTTRSFLNKDGMTAVLSTPTKYDSTANSMVINSLMVKTADNTLFRFDAYIFGKSYGLKEKYQKLSEKVFKTLAKGTRTINRSAREQTMAIYGSSKKFVFKLPANYYITEDQKYDFQVFKIHKYKPLTDTTWQSVIVYTGQHPSPVYADHNLTREDGKQVAGKFLGKDVTWLSYHFPEDGMYEKEEVIPCKELGDDMLVHISMATTEENTMAELSKIVEEIRLVDK